MKARKRGVAQPVKGSVPKPPVRPAAPTLKVNKHRRVFKVKATASDLQPAGDKPVTTTSTVGPRRGQRHRVISRGIKNHGRQSAKRKASDNDGGSPDGSASQQSTPDIITHSSHIITSDADRKVHRALKKLKIDFVETHAPGDTEQAGIERGRRVKIDFVETRVPGDTEQAGIERGRRVSNKVSQASGSSQTKNETPARWRGTRLTPKSSRGQTSSEVKKPESTVLEFASEANWKPKRSISKPRKLQQDGGSDPASTSLRLTVNAVKSVSSIEPQGRRSGRAAGQGSIASRDDGALMETDSAAPADFVMRPSNRGRGKGRTARTQGLSRSAHAVLMKVHSPQAAKSKRNTGGRSGSLTPRSVGGLRGRRRVASHFASNLNNDLATPTCLTHVDAQRSVPVARERGHSGRNNSQGASQKKKVQSKMQDTQRKPSGTRVSKSRESSPAAVNREEQISDTGQPGANGGQQMTVTPGEGQPRSFFSSQGFYGSGKRKRDEGSESAPQSRDNSPSLSKRIRMLQRLRDSSTKEIPDVLPSHSRVSRSSLSTHSPSLSTHSPVSSRESSPGNLPKPRGRWRLAKAGQVAGGRVEERVATDGKVLQESNVLSVDSGGESDMTNVDSESGIVKAESVGDDEDVSIVKPKLGDKNRKKADRKSMVKKTLPVRRKDVELHPQIEMHVTESEVKQESDTALDCKSGKQSDTALDKSGKQSDSALDKSSSQSDTALGKSGKQSDTTLDKSGKQSDTALDKIGKQSDTALDTIGKQSDTALDNNGKQSDTALDKSGKQATADLPSGSKASERNVTTEVSKNFSSMSSPEQTSKTGRRPGLGTEPQFLTEYTRIYYQQTSPSEYTAVLVGVDGKPVSVGKKLVQLKGADSGMSTGGADSKLEGAEKVSTPVDTKPGPDCNVTSSPQTSSTSQAPLSSSPNQAPLSSSSDGLLPAKRRPGRPKKERPVEVKVKRRPGRPRRVDISESRELSPGQSPIVSPTKAKPGRPKKIRDPVQSLEPLSPELFSSPLQSPRSVTSVQSPELFSLQPSTNTSPVSPLSPDGMPVKRRPGRPRVRPLQPTVKGKVGRPRVRPLQPTVKGKASRKPRAVLTLSAAALIKVKRKPGRPKKEKYAHDESVLSGVDSDADDTLTVHVAAEVDQLGVTDKLSPTSDTGMQTDYVQASTTVFPDISTQAQLSETSAPFRKRPSQKTGFNHELVPKKSGQGRAEVTPLSPTLEKLRKIRRIQRRVGRKTRWASGRLPKQSLKALGKVPRASFADGDMNAEVQDCVSQSDKQQQQSVGDSSHTQQESVSGVTDNNQQAVAESSDIQPDTWSMTGAKSICQEIRTDVIDSQQESLDNKSDIQQWSVGDTSEIQQYIVSDASDIQQPKVSDTGFTQQQTVDDTGDIQQQKVNNISNSQQQTVDNISNVQQQTVDDTGDIQQQTVGDNSSTQQQSVDDTNDSQQQTVDHTSSTQQQFVDDRVDIRQQKVSDTCSIQQQTVGGTSDIQQPSVGEVRDIKHQIATEAKDIQQQAAVDDNDTLHLTVTDAIDTQHLTVTDAIDTLHLTVTDAIDTLQLTANDAVDTQQQTAAAASDITQQIVTEASGREQHRVTDAREIQPSSVVDASSDIQQQTATDASDIQQQTVTDVSDTQQQAVTDASDIQQQTVTDASDIQQQSVTDASDIQQKSVTGASDIQQQSVTDVSDIQQQSVTDVSDNQHTVTDDGDIQQQTVTDASDIQQQTAADPLAVDTDQLEGLSATTCFSAEDVTLGLQSVTSNSVEDVTLGLQSVTSNSVEDSRPSDNFPLFANRVRAEDTSKELPVLNVSSEATGPVDLCVLSADDQGQSHSGHPPQSTAGTDRPLEIKPKGKIPRELKRLVIDDGRQGLTGRLAKKRVKELSRKGFLLRSRTKEKKTQVGPQTCEESDTTDVKVAGKTKAKKASKMYSVDPVSETKLIFKSGPKSVLSKLQKDVYSTADSDETGNDASIEDREGMLQIDLEDGPPPNITDTELESISPSEGLSPPPLIRPEDLFSGQYFTKSPSLKPGLTARRETVSDRAVAGPSSQSMKDDQLKSDVAGGDLTVSASDIATEYHYLYSVDDSQPRTKRKPGRPPRSQRGRRKMGPASKTGRAPHIRPGPASSKPGRKPRAYKADLSVTINLSKKLLEPRRFALRPKTTRSPIEIIAMRQKQEEEEYDLEEATRQARRLKRRQAHVARLNLLAAQSDSETNESCKSCSVVLVDFVKKLQLDALDTSDQYVSDVSYDSAENDDDTDEYVHDTSGCGSGKKRRTPGKELSVPQPSTSKEKESPSEKHATQSPEALEVKKPSPDLESLRGKGFVGNFVDFLENRHKQQQPSKSVLRSRWTKPSTLSQTIAQSATASTDKTSEQVDTQPEGPDGSTPSSVQDVDMVTSGTKSADTQSSAFSSFDVSGEQIENLPPCKPPVSTCVEFGAEEASASFLASTQTHSQSDPSTSQEEAQVSSLKSLTSGAFTGKLKIFPTSEKTVPARYMCRKCDFTSTVKQTMESHVYRHIPGVTFRCGYCNSEFSAMASVQTHIKNSHPARDALVWISKEVCEANLYTVDEATLGMSPSTQQHHLSDPAAIASQICESPSVQETQPLIISLVVRSEVRPEHFGESRPPVRRFVCTHCGYATNINDDMKQHVKDLHRSGDLYCCYLCDRECGLCLEEIQTHCAIVHTDRPNAYKRLPDFYDQEQMRGGGRGERSKTEDPGNIFDRMSNLFQASSPGRDGGEEGQLSPRTHFQRARDYMHILEGMNRKTTVEADSTTIGDIEVTPDDLSESALADIDSTVAEERDIADAGALTPCYIGPDRKTGEDEPSSSMEATDDKTLTTSGDDCQTKRSDAGPQGVPIHSQQKSNDVEGSVTRAAAGSEAIEDSTEASPSQLDLASSLPPGPADGAQGVVADKLKTVVSSGPDTKPVPGASGDSSVTGETVDDGSVQNSGEKGVSDMLSTLTVFCVGTCGDAPPSLSPSTAMDKAGVHQGPYTSTKAEISVSLHSSTELSTQAGDEARETTAMSYSGQRQEEAAVSKASIPSNCQQEGPSGDGVAPTFTADHVSAGSEAEVVDDDGDGDILVIELDDEDAVNEGVIVSRENSREPAAPETNISTADDDNNNVGGGDDEDNMGIQILEVVSLRDKADFHGLRPSPVKSPPQSPAGSAQPSSSQKPSPAPVSCRPSAKSGSCSSGTDSETPGKREQPAPPNLPEVDADEIATRNERLVCTYKCYKCNVHSPALSAIVEHLKQYHRDVPLFSCPYCKVKRGAFYSEEEVHVHVKDAHPNNYAKNEVSLSEVAKSFVQVLAIPSGRNSGGGLTEQDVYMCLKCQNHVPDLDYAFKHLQLEHPGLIKYACPTCKNFRHHAQDVVQQHMMREHRQAADCGQLSLAIEDNFFTRVTSISEGGMYCDHASATPASPSAKKTPAASSSPSVTASKIPTSSTVPNFSASETASTFSSPSIRKQAVTSVTGRPVAGDSPLLTTPSPTTHTPIALFLAPVQHTPIPGFPVSSPLGIPLSINPLSCTAAGLAKSVTSISSGSVSVALGAQPTMVSPSSALPLPRAILPQPTNSVDTTISSPPRSRITGMTVKDMLSKHRKSGDSGAALEAGVSGPATDKRPTAVSAPDTVITPLSVITTTPPYPAPDTPSPRRMFSMTDRLDRLGHSRDRAHRCLSPSTSHSRTAVTASPTPTPPPYTSPATARPVLNVPSLSLLRGHSVSGDVPLSVNTGTGVNTLMDATKTTMSGSRGRLHMHTSPVAHLGSSAATPIDAEDPDSYKIFNLKPRSSPAKQSASPVVPKNPTPVPAASPRASPHTAVTSSSVSMASSALFPQQFRVQQPPSTPRLTAPPAIQPPSTPRLTAPPAIQPLDLAALGPGAMALGPHIIMTARGPLLLPTNLGVTLMPGLGLGPAPAAHQQPATPTPPISASVALAQQTGFPRMVQGALQGTAKTSRQERRQSPPPTSTHTQQHPTQMASHTSTQQRPPQMASHTSTHQHPRQMASHTSTQQHPPHMASHTSTQQLPPHMPSHAPPAQRPPILPQPPQQQEQRYRTPSPSSAPRSAPRLPRHTSHLCECPYCPAVKVLNPWEVSSHIQTSHPGKKVVYKRV